MKYNITFYFIGCFLFLIKQADAQNCEANFVNTSSNISHAYVAITSNSLPVPNYNGYLSSFTISFNFDASSDGVLFSSCDSPNGATGVGDKRIYIVNGVLYAGIYNNGVRIINSGVNVINGGCHHVALVQERAPNIIKLYVDGTLTGSIAGVYSTDPSNTIPFYWILGRATMRNDWIPSTNTPLRATIDDVSIWSRALSSAEVNNILLTNDICQSDPNLLWYFTFNECNNSFTNSISQYQDVMQFVNGLQTINAHCSPTPSSQNPVITPNGPTSFCTNVVLDAGSGYNSYLWSSGQNTQTITVSQSGSYSVTVTNSAGCQYVSSPISVTSNSPSVSISANGPTGFCLGDSVTIDAGSGYSSYSWSNGETSRSITVFQTGAYSVTATNNSGCSAASNIINVNASGLNYNVSSIDETCLGNNDGQIILTANGGLQPIIYDIGTTTNNSGAFNNLPPNTYNFSISDNTGCTVYGSTTVNQGGTLSVNDSVSNVTFGCGNDGAIYTSAIGGSVNYNWSTGTNSPSITGLNSGNYSLTVTNTSGCILIRSYTVNDPNAISISASISANGSTTICPNDQVTLNTITGNYNYVWLKDGTPISGQTGSTISVSDAGTYEVIVSQNGGACADTSSQISISVYPAPSTPLEITYPVKNYCAGDVVNLSASTGYASYQWSNNDTGSNTSVTQTGNYSVTATDANGCTVSASRRVTINPIPTVIPSLIDTTICSGASVYVEGTGANGYAWGPFIDVLPSSTKSYAYLSPKVNRVYTLTGWDLGCADTAYIDITVNPSPEVEITENGNQLEAVAPNATGYQWYLDGVAISGASGSQLNITESGDYSVLATAANGCSTLSEEKSIDDFVGITSPGAISEIEVIVFPNPISDGVMNIKISSPKSTDIELFLFDINGKQVYQSSEIVGKGDMQFRIELPTISSGIYFLQFSTKSSIERDLGHKIIVR